MRHSKNIIRLSRIEACEYGYIVFNRETFTYFPDKESITGVDRKTLNVVACTDDDKFVIVVSNNGNIVSFKRLALMSVLEGVNTAPYASFTKGSTAVCAIEIHENESLCAFVLKGKRSVFVRIFDYEFLSKQLCFKTPLSQNEKFLYIGKLNTETTKKYSRFTISNFNKDGFPLDFLVDNHDFWQYVPEIVRKGNYVYRSPLDPTKPIVEYKKYVIPGLPASSVFSSEIPKASGRFDDSKYRFRQEVNDLVKGSSGNRFRATFVCPICYQERISGYSYINESGHTVRVCDFCRAEILRLKGWVHIIYTNMGHGR